MNLWNRPWEEFHLAHPLHLFLSSLVTSAMFWKYGRSLFKGVVVGLLGSIPICTISDIFFPFFGSKIFQSSVPFHFCLIAEPGLILSATILGIVVGHFLIPWVYLLTRVTHMMHVLVSSLASMLYLVLFIPSLWQEHLLAVFLITVLAVWIPCCLSDIVFPLMFTGSDKPGCVHCH